MRKRISTFAVMAAILMVTACPAFAGGHNNCGNHDGGKVPKASGKIIVQTGTNLGAGKFPGGGWMGATQTGSIVAGAKGDGVKVDGGFDTDYSQHQRIPGGSQEESGEQWGSVQINTGK